MIKKILILLIMVSMVVCIIGELEYVKIMQLTEGIFKEFIKILKTVFSIQIVL